MVKPCETGATHREQQTDLRDVTQNITKPQPTPVPSPADWPPSHDGPEMDRRTRQTESLRLLWNSRRVLVRATVSALLISTLVAFLIPASYTSTTQLMPPDSQSSSGMAMLTALAKAGGGGLGSLTGDLLGLKSTGDLFVGMLRSESCQANLVQQFDLKKEYGVKLAGEARRRLDERTSIAEDRKSGIISITVTDRSPLRAAALANAYVDQLNALVTALSTSSAHRERVFLEDRLKLAKQDLDQASSELAQFSSQNSTLDMQQMGKAMLDAAGNVAAQLVAANSELQGLRRIYTDDNARVQALSARVEELRRQLARLQGGPGSGEDRSEPNLQTASVLPAVPAQTPYPSIRSLPLLGVKYSDFYRRSKIQETVYELLTEQYELAKIQEAKETPSVKVLDQARTPEKKSFPPRMQFIVLGTCLGLATSVVSVAVLSNLRAADPQDPRKLLVQEAVGALKGWMLGVSRNGVARSWATKAPGTNPAVSAPGPGADSGPQVL